MSLRKQEWRDQLKARVELDEMNIEWREHRGRIAQKIEAEIFADRPRTQTLAEQKEDDGA